jgi:hypothetical protein
MQSAAQLALPHLFEPDACATHLNRVSRVEAVRFVGEVLERILCTIAYDPTAGRAAYEVAEDPRWKLAVSIANPLSLWGDLRFPKIFAERTARMEQVIREHGLTGPAGLALAAARQLAHAALYTEHVPRSALVEAIGLAIQSEVLHGVAHGADPAQVQAAAQARLLTMANRKPATLH